MSKLKLPTQISQLLQWKYFPLLVLSIMAMLLFANVAAGPFLFDDSLFITRNADIRSLANLPSLFSRSTTAGSLIPDGNFYRPLQQVIYTLIYALGGVQPLSYRLPNIILHLANSYLVFLIIKELKFSRKSALLSAILFLVHPVQMQAVSYISGLADPLALFFLMLGFITFKKLLDLISTSAYKPKRKLILSAGVILLQLLALFSKENMVVFWPLLLAYAIWRKRRNKQQQLPYMLIAVGILITCIYIYLRLTALNFTGVTGLFLANNLYTDSLSVRILTFIGTLPKYLLLLIFPKELSYEKYPQIYTNFGSLEVIIGLGLLLGVVLGVFRSYKTKGNYGYWLLWIIISLLPFSGLIPLNAIYLEHWLYVAMVGVAVIFAYVSERLWGLDKRLIFFPAGVIVILFMRSIARNAEWANPEIFFQHEIAVAPYSARMYNNLGSTYADMGKSELAVYNFEQAIKLDPNKLEPRYNLAREYLKESNPGKAFELLISCLESDPNFYYAHELLAQMYKASNKNIKAAKFAEFAKRISQGGRVKTTEIQQVLAAD